MSTSGGVKLDFEMSPTFKLRDELNLFSGGMFPGSSSFYFSAVLFWDDSKQTCLLLTPAKTR
jgi:hypothetical protein